MIIEVVGRVFRAASQLGEAGPRHRQVSVRAYNFLLARARTDPSIFFSTSSTFHE